jgi:hypothetical protein
MGTATDLLENNHTFFTKTSYCSTCHDPVVSNPSDPAHPFRDIRFSSTGTDFDGDGDAAEGIYFEIWDTLVPALLAEIQLYAGTVIGTNIAYDPVTYPYFFKDTNGNGIADPSEANFGNRYNLFDATLLKAAYNYQVVQKDPCGYIHNGMYVLQMLIDSIEDLGGDVRNVVIGLPTAVPGMLGGRRLGRSTRRDHRHRLRDRHDGRCDAGDPRGRRDGYGDRGGSADHGDDHHRSGWHLLAGQSPFRGVLPDVREDELHDRYRAGVHPGRRDQHHRCRTDRHSPGCPGNQHVRDRKSRKHAERNGDRHSSRRLHGAKHPVDPEEQRDRHAGQCGYG